MKKVLKALGTVGILLVKLFLATIGGVVALYLLQGVGQLLTQYVLTGPLWQIWVAGAIVSGTVYLLVQANREG